MHHHYYQWTMCFLIKCLSAYDIQSCAKKHIFRVHYTGSVEYNFCLATAFFR